MRLDDPTCVYLCMYQVLHNLTYVFIILMSKEPRVMGGAVDQPELLQKHQFKH